MAVVGGIIGGGIFRTPATVAERLRSPAIVLLSGINYVGVRPAAITQNIFTILKLAALAALIAAGLFLTLPTVQPSNPPTAGVAALGAALVPVLFTYGGWQQTNFIAEEIVQPERNLPRALVLGVAVIGLGELLPKFRRLKLLGVARLGRSPATSHRTIG